MGTNGRWVFSFEQRALTRKCHRLGVGLALFFMISGCLAGQPAGASSKQDPAMNIQKGEEALAKGDYNRAIIELNDVLLKAPKSQYAPRALYQLARAFELSGDPIDARLIVQKLRSDHPDSPEARLAQTTPLPALEALAAQRASSPPAEQPREVPQTTKPTPVAAARTDAAERSDLRPPTLGLTLPDLWPLDTEVGLR
ncbi:MAG: outer membrane protein assembly factor BamD [Deltaproteobacteria bacterium]|nr:outer membrane protein assembly factor BamD [Deltaproteobacteria bacterium]